MQGISLLHQVRRHAKTAWADIPSRS